MKDILQKDGAPRKNACRTISGASVLSTESGVMSIKCGNLSDVADVPPRKAWIDKPEGGTTPMHTYEYDARRKQDVLASQTRQQELKDIFEQ